RAGASSYAGGHDDPGTPSRCPRSFLPGPKLPPILHPAAVLTTVRRAESPKMQRPRNRRPLLFQHLSDATADGASGRCLPHVSPSAALLAEVELVWRTGRLRSAGRAEPTLRRSPRLNGRPTPFRPATRTLG